MHKADSVACGHLAEAGSQPNLSLSRSAKNKFNLIRMKSTLELIWTKSAFFYCFFGAHLSIDFSSIDDLSSGPVNILCL